MRKIFYPLRGALGQFLHLICNLDSLSSVSLGFEEMTHQPCASPGLKIGDKSIEKMQTCTLHNPCEAETQPI